MNNLIIGKPRIEKVNSNYRLISEIRYGKNKKYDLWFEVEKEYKKYLCKENSDSFLVALIPYLIKHELNVSIEGYISSRLYYQLVNYLIPLVCDGLNKPRIKIFTKTTKKVFSGEAVGTGVSCGVDSFYTILKHQNLKDKKYNLTHLTFFNVGSHGQYGGKKARKLFHQRLSIMKKFCEQYNYKMVIVDSNMSEFIHMSHFATCTFRTLSCVLALQKLFGIYYFSSSTNFNDTSIVSWACDVYDLLNVQCLSNGSTTFYSSGIETTRMGKIEYISNNKITYKWLNVCISDSEKNCGICEKCLRTMIALEAVNKLENYKSVFDIEEFKKHKIKIYSHLLKRCRDKNYQNRFITEEYKEILHYYKKNNIKIPIGSYILSYIPTLNDIKSFLKRHLSKKTIIKIQKKRGTYEDNGWI